MSTTDEVTLTFHGSSFLELAYKQTTVFIDPVFSSSRRGRRLRGATRPCDYVFVTQASDNFDDILDVLEDAKDAVLVAAERVVRMARSELGLGRGRALDLEPWERASEDAFRVTAVPIFAPSMMDDSASLLEDLSDGLGRVVPRGLSRLPMAGVGSAMRSMRALGGLPFIGNQLLSGLRGTPALGYFFEIGAGQRILDLSNGVHAGTDERELEDIASLAEADVLVLDVNNQGIEAVVRAVRVVGAPTVLVYRSQDPYVRGRRAVSQPISAYIEAITEDGGDKIEALHLREGDRFVLSAPEKAPAPATTNRVPVGSAQAAAPAAPRVAKPA
jgi:hypothetical protein